MLTYSMHNNNSGTYFKKIKGQSKKDKSDDYSTPQSAWDDILRFLESEGITKDKIIYEPFYLDGGSGDYIRQKGYKVLHEREDFYEKGKEAKYDYILTNPAFSDCKGLFEFLDEIDKPFVMLLPTLKLHTQYMARFFEDRNTQLVIPRRRIHFMKYVDGVPVPGWKKGTSFDCVWICHNMGFRKDINYSKDT